jgi:glycosyltransferase involved in cell wall biosynthesis
MKILVINWQDIKNPLAGGAEVHLHEVFSRIAHRGHDVTLFCSSFAGAHRTERLDGITVIREGGRLFFNFRFFLAYFTGLRNGQWHIVVDDMNKIPFFTPLFVRQPLYGVVHHLFGRSIFREVNFLLASYVFLMESIAVGVYRRRRVPFIVGSPSTQNELLRRGFPQADIFLIPYGVDHHVHRPTGVSKSPGPLIGYFGRLKKYKSVDHLLKALPRVLQDVPDLKVLIVGEGDDRPRLETLARDLGIGAALEFTGFVTESKKIELLQTMWCKVTTSSKEGWGLTVIEANACGTPVLASDVPGLRDAVRDGETGLLYAYGDIGDLADKILLFLNDQTLRERLTVNALRWASNFSWDSAAQQTLQLLEQKVMSNR